MADIIGAVNIEAFFIVPEPYGEKRMVHQYQVAGIQRDLQLLLDFLCASCHTPGHDKLPQAQVLDMKSA